MVKLTIIVCIGINLFVCGTVLAKSGIEVTGIIHKDTPIAIINDKIVQEGDEIDGYLANGKNKSWIATKLGVSRPTLYTFMKKTETE